MKFVKKFKDKVKNAVKNVPKPKVDKIIKNVGKAIEQGKKGIAVAPLIPYIPLMKAIMKKRGVTIPRDPDDLVKSFYQNIIKKGIKNDSIEPVTITLIVSAVLSFFANMKKKRDEEKATNEEKQIADKADEVGEVADAMKDVGQGLLTAGNTLSPQPTIGTLANSLPQPVLWGIIALIGYILYKKM
jgi:hypothetical protein